MEVVDTATSFSFRSLSLTLDNDKDTGRDDEEIDDGLDEVAIVPRQRVARLHSRTRRVL